jgi:hypothetical protein
MKIEIDLDVTNEMVNNILTDAFETDAISYWVYEFSKPQRDKELNVIEFEIVEDNENDEDTKKKYVINCNTVFEGIRKLFSKDFQISKRIKNQILNNDIDAEGTDCIIQAGLFGEIIYG